MSNDQPTGQGSSIDGDQFNMSGNFSGAILNIKSTLENVSQSIGAAPHGDQVSKDELKQLIDQLNAELQKPPAGKESDAEAVAMMAKQTVEQATAQKPNKTMIQISADGLKQAAANIGAVMPAVIDIAGKIASAVMKIVPS